jgi:hypothetical protein
MEKICEQEINVTAMGKVQGQKGQTLQQNK